MRRAFTLIEVNLAIMVMAVGVLGLISLYSLGYRESEQSNEDVEAAALAERNLNALVTMLSSTNMTWSAWNQIGTIPSGGGRGSGWGAYFNESNIKGGSGGSGVSGETNSRAESVYAAVQGKCSGCEGSDVPFYRGSLQCGLVVHQSGGRCALSFRAGRRAGSMIYQPLYYTEVFFQGDPAK